MKCKNPPCDRANWYGDKYHGYCLDCHNAGVEELLHLLAACRETLSWAQNQLNHDTDETNCCYMTCASCKAIQANPVWKDWWNKGHDPILAILAQLPDEARQ